MRALTVAIALAMLQGCAMSPEREAVTTAALLNLSQSIGNHKPYYVTPGPIGRRDNRPSPAPQTMFVHCHGYSNGTLCVAD